MRLAALILVIPSLAFGAGFQRLYAEHATATSSSAHCRVTTWW